MIRVKKLFIPEGAMCDTKKWMSASSVTIHWIGPYPAQTPEQVRDWWIKSGGEASAHYIIKDDKCIQCWPDTKVAWHCGNKKGNESSIGIEIVPMNASGEFSEQSINTLRELIALRFSTLPILRHYDWSGKNCPAYYCDDKNWSTLLKSLS